MYIFMCLYVFVACMYVCLQIYVYMYSYFKKTGPLCVHCMIRIYAADVNSTRYRSHSQGACSVFPCLNNFIRTSKWDFVFICCFSNSVIVANYSRVLNGLRIFPFVLVYSDLCISNLLYDSLGGSCLGQILIGPDFFQSGGTQLVPQIPLPQGLPSRGQSHLHMYHVD